MKDLVNREKKHEKREKKEERDASFRILKRLVEKGPAYPRDLQKELHLTKGTVDYNRKILLKYGFAKKLKDNRYAFIKYVDREETVIQAIKKWKEVALRDPTPKEIADEVGIPFLKVEALAHKTKRKTGWSMPNQAIIESATEKLGEVLVCAARIRDGKISSFDYKQDSEIIEEARVYLKKHPEMLPKLDEDGKHVVSWPLTALKYLGKIYKPKDRLKAVFMTS